MTTTETDHDRLASILHDLRRVHATGITRDIKWRLEQLIAIRTLITEREPEIATALDSDLGRSPVESWLGDLAPLKGEVDYALKHLRKWMRPQKQSLPLKQRPGSAWIQYEPLGVSLVVGPWNYPVLLTLAPLIAAVSAGNCAVVKPSELAPATSALLSRLIPEYLDSTAISVVEGDGLITQELLGLGFDHALFTGGTEVGRKILSGAAQTLTPVILELGGKSPAIVTRDADLDVTARRIAWVKYLNSGQTCIAPDYVLVDAKVREEFLEKLTASIETFHVDGSSGKRIVNRRQFDRLVSYLDATLAKVALGGRSNADDLTIEPTVLVDPDPHEPSMQDEIFGPILPVMSYGDIEEAVAFVKSRPKPLGLYVFSKSKSSAKKIIDRIPAGGAVINHVAMHCLIPSLPFGGIGASGMGAYHGEWGFQALSHRKAVLAKPTKPDLRLIYPPYSERAKKLLRSML